MAAVHSLGQLVLRSFVKSQKAMGEYCVASDTSYVDTGGVEKLR